MKRILLGLVLVLIPAACGVAVPSSSTAPSPSMPSICDDVRVIHQARDTILAALKKSEAGEYDLATRLALQARSEISTFLPEPASSSTGPTDGDRELRLGLLSVSLFVSQVSQLLDGSTGPPDLRNIDPPIETFLPTIDQTLSRVDQLATAGTSSDAAPCAGAAFSFVPAALLVSVPAPPDLGGLRLPNTIDGETLTVSVEWVQGGTVLAAFVTEMGRSARSAVLADAETDSGLSFSILRVPGLDMGPIVDRYAAAIVPEASDKRLVVIEAVTVHRFDTSDPEAPSETLSLVPRGELLLIFEDATETQIAAVLRALK